MNLATNYLLVGNNQITCQQAGAFFFAKIFGQIPYFDFLSSYGDEHF
jgi:hypothetical protein